MNKNFNRAWAEVNFGKYFIIVDFDANNPASPSDPNVRIGAVPKHIITAEEHASFVARTPVIGKASEVFPGAKGPKDIDEVVVINTFLEKCPGRGNIVLGVAGDYLPEEVLYAVAKLLPDELFVTEEEE